MPIQLNSAGVPKGTGTLHMRGNVYWMIYTDEAGRKIQTNTGTGDRDQARRVLAEAAIVVLRAQLTKLRDIRDESPHQPAAGASGARGRRAPAQANARGGKKNSEGGSR